MSVDLWNGLFLALVTFGVLAVALHELRGVARSWRWWEPSALLLGWLVIVGAVASELDSLGEEGSLFLDDPWHCHNPVLELRTEKGTERIELEPADSYQLQLENVSDSIRGRAEPLLGREDALGQARAIEALYRSAEEGRSVALSTLGGLADR